MRRIIGKVVVSAIGQKNISYSLVGSLQICAGHEAGCKAAVHSKDSIFSDKSTDAVVLIDTENAFTSVNKEPFIHNVEITCPAFSTFV